jgi:hypothetical protein
MSKGSGSNGELNRRSFLKATGAAAAGTVLAGCSEDEQNTEEETLEDISMDELVEAELGRPDEQSTILLDEDYKDLVQGVRITGDPEYGEKHLEEERSLEELSELKRGRIGFEFTPEKVQEFEVQVLGKDGKKYTLEPEDTEEKLRTPEKSFKDHYNNLPYFAKDKQFLDISEIEEIEQETDNLGRKIEEIHNILTKDEDNTFDTRKEYSDALRKAVHEEAEIPVEEAIIKHTIGAGAWTETIREVSGAELDSVDISQPFPGETSYLRENEPFDPYSNEGALNNANVTSTHPANVIQHRKAYGGDVEEELLEEKLAPQYDKQSDTIFVIPNPSNNRIEEEGNRHPHGWISFEYHMGEVLGDLRKHKDFIENGSKFYANHVTGDGEYMHVGEIEQLKEKYGEAEELAEYDGETYGATLVDLETHEQANIDLLKTEDRVEN